MTGKLNKEILDALLETLPVDITFVDKDDIVRYYNKSEIFPRQPTVIGTRVQDCHSKKSQHRVNQILDDFKNNRRESVEQRISKDNRKIYIRYFAVRDKNGNYLGCFEVAQDTTKIKK